MEQEKEHTEKLLVDNISDFKFHAAYMAYSEAWDENTSDEIRTKLNGLISLLSSGEANYGDFYYNLNQFRKQRSGSYLRARIQSQRKSDWRRSEKKSARNSRYRE